MTITRAHIARPVDDRTFLEQERSGRIGTLCGVDRPAMFVFDQPVPKLPMCPTCMAAWESVKDEGRSS